MQYEPCKIERDYICELERRNKVLSIWLIATGLTLLLQSLFILFSIFSR